MNENPELCSTCGGKCCKRLPGAASPEDFGENVVEGILEKLRSGDWSLDWWEGDPRDPTPDSPLSRVLFPRPRTKETYKLLDPSWGGECIFLRSDGCMLPAEDRPWQCRELVPQPNNECKGKSKQETALAWLPFADQLEELAKNL